MHQRALDKLEERRKALHAGSFGGGAVQVVHQDGSTMFFHYAFAERFEQWWLVFTEHCGYHAFYNDDLESISYFVQKPVSEEDDDDEAWAVE